MHINRISAALVIGVCAVSASHAATAEAPHQEKALLEQVIMADNTAIIFGEMAEKSGPALNSFGVMLVQDHIQCRERATALAKRMGVTPPDRSTADDARERTKLQKLKGPMFAHELVAYMTRRHRKAISDLMQAAKGSGPIAEFARAVLPNEQKHLRFAEGLRQQGT